MDVVKKYTSYENYYYFNTFNWNPNESEWIYYLSLIQPEERKRINRFKRPCSDGHYLIGKDNPDAKKALIGRIMLRHFISKMFEFSWNELVFCRTKKNKPYLFSPLEGIPNGFNFNISHSGYYVVIGFSTMGIIGIDVEKIEVRGRGGISSFFKDLKSCFTPYEWSIIQSKDITDREALRQFFIHWTRKEAYIKSIGIGLGFELQRIEFHNKDDSDTDYNEDDSIQSYVYIDGKIQNKWYIETCFINDIESCHVVSIALGPFKEAEEGFKETIKSYHTLLNTCTIIKKSKLSNLLHITIKDMFT